MYTLSMMSSQWIAATSIECVCLLYTVWLLPYMVCSSRTFTERGSKGSQDYLEVVDVAILGDGHNDLITPQFTLHALQCIPHCCCPAEQEQHITCLYYLQFAQLPSTVFSHILLDAITNASEQPNSNKWWAFCQATGGVAAI